MTDLISRADAIALLTEIVFDEPPYFDSETLCRLYAEEQINKLPSAEVVQGWIPCSERLPKTGDSVLVTYSDGEVDIIWSARPKAWVKYEEANNLIFIFPVAWMPLPKPYKGGDEE